MADKKPAKPDAKAKAKTLPPLHEYISRSEQLKNWKNVLNAAHSDVYIKLHDKYFKDGDLRKFNDEDFRKTWTNEAMDLYRSKYKDVTGQDLPSDWKLQHGFLQHVFGVTEDSLLEGVREHGEDYSVQVHEGRRDKMVKKVHEALAPQVIKPISDIAHDAKKVDALIKSAGLEAIVGASKAKTPEEKVNHLLDYLTKTQAGQAHYAGIRDKLNPIKPYKAEK